MNPLRATNAGLRRLTLCGLLVFSTAGAAIAQDAKTDEKAEEKPEPKSSVTVQSAEIGRQTIEYTATAGYLIVNNADEEPAAQFGYTAYVRKDAGDLDERPIMFAYNGGPGSASVWLHLGVLGPRRVVTADAESTLPPPYKLVDNAYSILDETDLVMIDPVGTGYSRPVGKAKGEDFWGVDQDIDSVSRFIKAYVTQNSRWASPKILLGESYGGMRSGGVSHKLLTAHGMALNGVVLVSPFMSWSSGFDGLNVDLPHILFLPTLAATAWYHDALETRPDELRPFIEQVKAFAYDEYAPALLKGSRLTGQQRADVLAKLAQYTGVSETYWDRANLRVSHQQFVTELLRDRKQVAGRIDSRFAGRNFNLLGESMSYDPFNASVAPAFTATFLDYYHRELEFGRDLEYKVSAPIFQKWDWGHTAPGGGMKNPVPNTAVDLARAMGLNPNMKLLVQQGYYDLATPQAATEYALEHMDLLPEQRANIDVAYYEAGHMMYLHPPSLEKFKEDLAKFLRKACAPRN